MSKAIKEKHLESIESLLVILLKEPENYEAISAKIQGVLTKIFDHQFLHDFKNRLCVLYLCSEMEQKQEFLREVQKTIAWLNLYKIALYNFSNPWEKIVDFAKLYDIQLAISQRNHSLYPVIIYHFLYCSCLVKKIDFQQGELKIIGITTIPRRSPGLPEKLLSNEYSFSINKNSLIISLKKISIVYDSHMQ